MDDDDGDEDDDDNANDGDDDNICSENLTTEGECRCPCEDCDNHEYQRPNIIRIHIHNNGFSERYKIWKWNGEEIVLPPPIVNVIPEPTDRLHDLVNDLWDDSFVDDHTIDVDEPSNTTSAPHARNDRIKELDKLDETPLYAGCPMSSFNFLAKMMHMKVDFKWTNTSFDHLLQFLKTAFPPGSVIPSSHYEAKKKMSEIGLGYESIHVCKNDCCLFWKENKKLNHCSVCKTSRWKDENTSGKKVAHKVLRYFPLTPRLQQLYKSSMTAKDMIWHATGQCKEVGKMRHLVDGTSWKKFDARYPDFAREPRNVRLGLCTDGFNPFGNMSNSYSMWPVILTTCNLPPWLCMKESTFMLTLLIPGPRSPGKDIDVFLRPLVDEL
ncbi:uncharacterized protein [Rutidosis leptorrhynchoides]|uniref:uncharacterized protein n=1 Tax=Rutidosis leptorrhynchoides TaxID=125765 RepID=UPI003A9949FA